MSEEFILKACKSSRKCVDTIIEKKKMAGILNKFTVLCLSCYFIVFFKLKLIADRLIGQVGRLFTRGSGVMGSIPGRVIPKTLKMVLDTSLLNTQQYKVRIKDKVEQSRGWSSALPNTSV